MKSFLQVVVPIVILMSVVGFVAYLTQYSSTGRDNNPNPVVPVVNTAHGEPLIFDVDPLATEQGPLEVEYLGFGHKDYWFHTTQERDVKVSLISKSCTCSDVLVGRFDISADEWAAMAAGPSLKDLCRLAAAVRFEKVGQAGDERVTVAATPAGKQPRPYILRVTWQAKKTALETKEQTGISVKIAAQTEGTAAQSVYSKDSPYNVVPAVGIFPFEMELAEIGVGGSQRAEFVVWSPTRSVLRPKIRLASSLRNDQPEPCAEFSPVVELTPEELKMLPAALGPEYSKINPKSGYRFVMTLHERRGEHQMDIGPLGRHLILNFETMAGEHPIDDLKIPIVGSVRGDVTVQGGDDRGRVSLGVYRSPRGASLRVYLRTQDPKVELDPNVTTSTAKIKATMGPREKSVDGYFQWPLTIEAAPNAFLGELKIDQPSPVVLVQTKAPHSRRLRIPVHGTAER